MADVYEAWDRLRTTPMAVKVLRRDLANNSHFVAHFEQEAELLEKLSHPNIVRLYDFLHEPGQPAIIVMEWVDGGNLRETLLQKKRPFTTDETSHILDPVSKALHFAHQNFVYHCDVKSPNILMPSDGRVLLTDFGVAHAALKDLEGGTPFYMAPEQFNGGKLDIRTDIYALGVTLYELLSGGSFPFRGDTPDCRGTTAREKMAWEHSHLPLPPLSTFNPNIPRAVEEVIQTAMCKDPSGRYGTTFELMDAFRIACSYRGGAVSRGSDLSQRNLTTVVRPEDATLPPKVKPEPPRESPPPQVPPVRPRVSSPLISGNPFLKAHSLCLFARTGEFAGQEIFIPRTGLTVGRSSQNQLHLTDPSVSRQHALIVYGQKSAYIQDQGSTLGTYVNNQLIDGPFLLKTGDIIRIGYRDIFEIREK